jgi:hypothetical protein
VVSFRPYPTDPFAFYVELSCGISEEFPKNRGYDKVDPGYPFWLIWKFFVHFAYFLHNPIEFFPWYIVDTKIITWRSENGQAE